MLWVELILGQCAWLTALFVGGYRQFCMLSERKYQALNTPMIWRRSAFRITTWAIVTAFSLLSSAAFAEMAGRVVSKPIAYAIFGSSLAVRYLGSVILAALYEKRVGIRGYPSIPQQRRLAWQDARLEKLAAELREALDEKHRWRLLGQFKWEIHSRHANLRWATSEIDGHIAFMEEGRALVSPDSAADRYMDLLDKEILNVVEEGRARDKEIAQSMFSSPEHKEILKTLKEIRASRND